MTHVTRKLATRSVGTGTLCPVAALAAAAIATGCDSAKPPPATTVLHPCVDGKAGDYDCKGVDLVSMIERGSMGDASAETNDLWGWTDPETGTEWAMVGHTTGLSFISLADPARPVYSGLLPFTEGASRSDWRDVKVYRNHAFVVSDLAGPHGMQVFDLERLRSAAGSAAIFSSDAVYREFHSAHNIAINEETGFAYVVGGSEGGETCGGGLHMIDIRTPKEPEFAGCFADPRTGESGTGYTHDAICVVYRGPDAEHRGKEICFGSNETHLSIADVTDKGAPVALAAASYPNVAYAHQAWIDQAHEYVYMNDELDEYNYGINTRTLIWDVKDLDDPVASEFLHETKAVDHNLHVVGDLMYQANYMAGFRILSIANRENPVEIAFFATESADGGGAAPPDGPGLIGAWGSYPFFASGVIPVTSIYGGVFFLKRSE